MPEQGVSLNEFTERDHTGRLATYIKALEAFDATLSIQELKALARVRNGMGPGRAVLDVGCGFGLETLRIAHLVAPGGVTAGIDLSEDFIGEARRRATAAGAKIDYRTGSADSLPFSDATFDIVRAERVLIYVDRWQVALAEMRRTLRPGGQIALIEPDVSTTTVNLPDRDLLRRVMCHEAEANVVNGWLPGSLASALDALGFADIALATRVVVFPADLGFNYFVQCGRSAADAGIIGADEIAGWIRGLASLQAAGTLFGTVGYFLFTGKRASSSLKCAPSHLSTSATEFDPEIKIVLQLLDRDRV